MKKSLTLLSGSFLLLTALDLSAQCNQVVLDDDFSTSSGWVSSGAGDVNVASGQCNFNTVYAGVDDRVYKNLPYALSNTYWKTDCKVTFNGQNPNGNGAGAIVLALTAGTQDFMTSPSMQETVQDGLAVVLTSSSASDEDRDNWFFLIEAKLGSNRTYNINTSVYLNSSIDTYYLRLERTAQGMSQMSVCTDAAFTQHISGSPAQFAVNTAMSGLNVVQHGNSVAGTTTRMFNGTIDDDYICHDGDVGIYDQTANTFHATVFPNPASGSIRVSLDSPTDNPVQYTVFSTNGSVLLNDVLKMDGTIDIAQLAQGCYVLMLVQDDKIFRCNFVKTE